MLSLVSLASHVESISGGLDADIVDGGANYSVGQRQMLCMARALLKPSCIVLMDEATSSMSNAVQDAIERTMHIQFAHCTIITIAHRLETIMGHDRVLCLDRGRIVEDGTPARLASDPNSKFAAMLTAAEHF